MSLHYPYWSCKYSYLAKSLELGYVLDTNTEPITLVRVRVQSGLESYAWLAFKEWPDSIPSNMLKDDGLSSLLRFSLPYIGYDEIPGKAIGDLSSKLKILCSDAKKTNKKNITQPEFNF